MTNTRDDDAGSRGKRGKPGDKRPYADAKRPARGPRGDAVQKRAPAEAVAASTEPTEERIAKAMARAGVASRRDAEVMIEEGRVRLNGVVLTSPAQNVTATDRIEIDGEAMPMRERTRLWLFHKPKGLVTTARDPEGRPTVFENLPEDLPRVVAVGRLDINTEGLLLLTNDGGVARTLELPQTGWLRRYRVRAYGDIDQARLDELKDGIAVEGVLYGAIEASLDRK
ncbi:MAG TPA: S4 domain-containing protein, partial [Saliniramus sp.]|nr:S4 domain-containing protein [Saliniramus sp.]